jgi:hypothetical protein
MRKNTLELLVTGAYKRIVNDVPIACSSVYDLAAGGIFSLAEVITEIDPANTGAYGAAKRIVLDLLLNTEPQHRECAMRDLYVRTVLPETCRDLALQAISSCPVQYKSS